MIQNKLILLLKASNYVVDIGKFVLKLLIKYKHLFARSFVILCLSFSLQVHPCNAIPQHFGPPLLLCGSFNKNFKQVIVASYVPEEVIVKELQKDFEKKLIEKENQIKIQKSETTHTEKIVIDDDYDFFEF